MGALETRASIQAHGDYYLCPLSALQVPAELLAQQVEAARASGQLLIQVERTQADGQTRCIARGYEHIETIIAQLDGVSSTWTERRRLLQSLAALQAAEQSLHTRLKQAQQALSELTVRRQGKAVLSERTEVEQAVADTLAHFRVQGLLHHCSFCPLATSASFAGVLSSHLFHPLRGFFRTPLKMSEP